MKRKQKYPAKERTESARRLRSPITGPARPLLFEPDPDPLGTVIRHGQRIREELKMENGATIRLRATEDSAYGTRTQFAWTSSEPTLCGMCNQPDEDDHACPCR